MVALLDSDDDDISSTVRRKNVKKHFRKKIDDESDSSSDENKGEFSKDDQSNVPLDKISDGDVTAGDNLDSSDESSKGQISGTVEISKANGDWSNDNLMVGEINGTNDDDLDKDCKNYKQNESLNEGIRNKNRKLKQRIHCFDDNESSDEEMNDKLKTPRDTRNKDLLSRSEEEYSSYENKTEDAPIQEHNDSENVNGPNDTDILEADDVDNILKNKEIFDADSESDNEIKSRIINDDDIEDNEDDELSNTQHGTKKEKRPGKDAQKEAKSEQQRLLREQKFKLPYHVPEVKPLKDFLLRVPVLKTKGWKRQLPSNEREIISNEGPLDNADHDKDEIREMTSSENVIVNVNDGVIPSKSENETPSNKIENLFKQKPKLSFGGEDIIEFDEIDDTDVASVKGIPKGNMNELDSFMRRFEKHTKSKGRKQIEKQSANSKSSSISSVVIPEKEKIPGGRRIAFAEQMKFKIRKERSDALKELERERKLFNEEDTSEEDEFNDDENGDVEDESEEVEGVKIVDNDGNSSNDEELEKWNVEDRRKALEIEMGEEEEKMKKTVNVNANSVDFSIEGQKTPHSDQSEKDDIHWDDTSSTVSSFLPAGQGDPTGCKNSVEGRMTPFSKLMKSGLLDSTSNLNYSNNSNSIGLTGGIALPCEDTQDLYKENFEKKEEDSQMVLNSLELNLEETQYTQVIDSQGFLSESKKSKRQLFDEDGKDVVNTFSQVLDLCSGKFDDVDNEKKTEGGINRFFEKDGFSMTQVIGLCSGKFTGDDDDAISSTRLDCADGSLSNPPIEHPFFSRINDTDKLSNKESCFSDTPENIFKMHTAGNKTEELDKPLGLSNIIDDNFDDNAMDFCTAPFSGTASDKDGEDVEESSSGKNGVLSQTKFDVGNWLNEGKLNGKKSERTSDRSMSEIGCKQKIIEEEHTEDNEDDVFADNEDESVCSDEEDDDGGGEDEISGGENTKGVVAEGEDEEEFEDDYYENEVNAELLEYQNSVSAKDKNKWSKKAFAEKEAELSGSDINSDAEELGSEYDEYEIDSDIEDLPSGEKLKSQVHKIHQKKLLDQDQREVRLLQELYIEDADRTYGKKRQRNFRWRNVAEDDGSYNLTGHSDDEVDELNLDNSISQKLERAEREKYISELEEHEKVSMDENSQSMLEMIKDPTKVIVEKPVPTAQSRKSSKSDMRHSSQKRTGSFMSQTKSSFSHLISTVKVGGQGGKSFVFQTAGEGDLKKEDKENRVAIRKTPMSEPVKKRAKFNVESSESQSIFDLL